MTAGADSSQPFQLLLRNKADLWDLEKQALAITTICKLTQRHVLILISLILHVRRLDVHMCNAPPPLMK